MDPTKTLLGELTLPDSLGRDSFGCSDQSQLKFVTDNERLAAIWNSSALVQDRLEENMAYQADVKNLVAAEVCCDQTQGDLMWAYRTKTTAIRLHD